MYAHIEKFPTLLDSLGMLLLSYWGNEAIPVQLHYFIRINKQESTTILNTNKDDASYNTLVLQYHNT